MPALADQRFELEALDQDPALVVQREVHRPDHLGASARPQPGLGRAQQRVEHLRVLLELEEAEHPGAAAVEAVVGEVDLGADPAHDPPLAAGEEVLGFAVAEVGVQPAVEEDATLEPQRRHPRGALVQPEGELDELTDLPEPAGWAHLHHGSGNLPDGPCP